VTSGGPEAIHQLAAALQALGTDARVVYVRWLDGTVGLLDSLAPGGLPPAFASYGTQESDSIEDSTHNVLILPEIWTQAIEEFRGIRTGIWWLSVDNNLDSPMGHYFAQRPPRSVVHLHQSNYAANYLRSNNVAQSWALGDYLNPSHGLDGRLLDVANELGPRRDYVLFNPKKGRNVTERLATLAADRTSSMSWVPIENLSAAEVALLLRVAKVYVDFGPHPGMDRLPREAAAAGCCVITGRSGAAAFQADLPIPERFRVDDDNLVGAVDRIFECVTNFEPVSAEFDSYRVFVAGQHARFLDNVRSIFSLDAV
jgi:hypothetical protein